VSRSPGHGPLVLPGPDARSLVARIQALSSAASVFGSAFSGVDLRLSWTVAKPRPALWRRLPDGSHEVHLEFHVGELASQDGVTSEVFRRAFLHELGHILYTPFRRSGEAREASLAWAAGDRGPARSRPNEPPTDPPADLATDPPAGLRPGGAAIARALPTLRGDQSELDRLLGLLEDARAERLLRRDFRGAGRILAPRHAALVELLGLCRPSEPTPATEKVEQLVILLYLRAAGVAPPPPSVARCSPWARWMARRLGRLLPPAPSGFEMALFGTFYVWPVVAGALGHRPSPGSSEEQVGGEARTGTRAGGAALPSPCGAGATSGTDRQSPVRPPVPGRTGSAPFLPAFDGEGAGHLRQEVTEGGAPHPSREIILYPHVDGSLVVDEIEVEAAAKVPSSSEAGVVVDDLHARWGNLAERALAPWAAALRAAFQVNHERRLAGAYLSGRRIGLSNLRRYRTRGDLRLFQRLEVPDRLSYYLHLLVDVSPSMFANQNAQMALAAAYALTAALEQVRIPVDVTLYSSAAAVLHRSSEHSLQRYFGRFGFRSAGTYEIEALALAKARADGADERRKIVVVLTDGRPNGLALYRCGASDLSSYYKYHLLPWLAAAGVEVVAIGVGTYPDYHDRTVCLTSSWEALGVFIQLLREMISEADARHHALWR
jgi:Mg-chelatase subunit ChlD